MGELSVRVQGVRDEALEVRSFALAASDGAALPAFAAGSHIDVHIAPGLVRQYSLCGDSADTARYQIAVKREPASRGGSQAMHERVREGDVLTISVPRNNFALVPAAKHHLLIAGGIGITPILAMIRSLEARGATSWKLYYLVRDRASAAFLDVLEGGDWAPRVRVHADGGDPGRSFDLWPVLEKPTRAHVYCCGPRPLMDAVRDMTGHWPTGSIHFESFVEGAALARPEDKPFVVRLARSGGEVAVPAGVTILEALRRAGLRVDSSCESGTCGTCKTGIVAGEPDHRDLVLMPDEQGSAIMVCVSRARSDELVLDL